MRHVHQSLWFWITICSYLGVQQYYNIRIITISHKHPKITCIYMEKNTTASLVTFFFHLSLVSWGLPVLLCLSWRHCPGLIPFLLGMESVYFWWFPSAMSCFAIRAVFIQVNGLFDRRTDGCGVRREMDRWSLQTDGLFVLERKYLFNNNPGLISMKPLSIFLWPNICHEMQIPALVPGGTPHFNSVLEHCGPGQLGIWVEVEMCNLAFMLNNFNILGHTEVSMLKNTFFAQNTHNRSCIPAHLYNYPILWKPCNAERASVNVQKIRKSLLKRDRRRIAETDSRWQEVYGISNNQSLQMQWAEKHLRMPNTSTLEVDRPQQQTIISCSTPDSHNLNTEATGDIWRPFSKLHLSRLWTNLKWE